MEGKKTIGTLIPMIYVMDMMLTSLVLPRLTAEWFKSRTSPRNSIRLR